MDILTWPLSQTVTDISSLAGIVGFVVTVKLFFTTRSLKATLRNKVRIPEIHSNLQKKASLINDAIGDWVTQKEFIRKEFTECAVLTESLFSRLPTKERSKIDIFFDEVKPKRDRVEALPGVEALKLNQASLLVACPSAAGKRM